MHDILLRCYVTKGTVALTDLQYIYARMGWAPDSKTLTLYLREVYVNVLQGENLDLALGIATQTDIFTDKQLQAACDHISRQLSTLFGATPTEPVGRPLAVADEHPSTITWDYLRTSSPAPIRARANAVYTIMGQALAVFPMCTIARAAEDLGVALKQRGAVARSAFSRYPDGNGLEVRLRLSGQYVACSYNLAVLQKRVDGAAIQEDPVAHRAGTSRILATAARIDPTFTSKVNNAMTAFCAAKADADAIVMRCRQEAMAICASSGRARSRVAQSRAMQSRALVERDKAMVMLRVMTLQVEAPQQLHHYALYRDDTYDPQVQACQCTGPIHLLSNAYMASGIFVPKLQTHLSSLDQDAAILEASKPNAPRGAVLAAPSAVEVVQPNSQASYNTCLEFLSSVPSTKRATRALKRQQQQHQPDEVVDMTIGEESGHAHTVPDNSCKRPLQASPARQTSARKCYVRSALPSVVAYAVGNPAATAAADNAEDGNPVVTAAAAAAPAAAAAAADVVDDLMDDCLAAGATSAASRPAGQKGPIGMKAFNGHLCAQQVHAIAPTLGPNPTQAFLKSVQAHARCGMNTILSYVEMYDADIYRDAPGVEKRAAAQERERQLKAFVSTNLRSNSNLPTVSGNLIADMAAMIGVQLAVLEKAVTDCELNPNKQPRVTKGDIQAKFTMPLQKHDGKGRKQESKWIIPGRQDRLGSVVAPTRELAIAKHAWMQLCNGELNGITLPVYFPAPGIELKYRTLRNSLHQAVEDAHKSTSARNKLAAEAISKARADFLQGATGQGAYGAEDSVYSIAGDIPPPSGIMLESISVMAHASENMSALLNWYNMLVVHKLCTCGTADLDKHNIIAKANIAPNSIERFMVFIDAAVLEAIICSGVTACFAEEFASEVQAAWDRQASTDTR